MEGISQERVRAQVQKFWSILSGKSSGNLEEFYAQDAIVFSGKSKRSEPAQLAAARRTRHLSAPVSDSNAEIGQLEVQTFGPVAIASYTYQFNEAKSSKEAGRIEKKTLYGRATQIFRLDDSGVLRIVHEHLSAGEAPSVEKA
jgi:ketosteroid isomerase-like protein